MKRAIKFFFHKKRTFEDQNYWSMIGKIILRKGRIQAKLGLGCKQMRLVSCWGTFCNLYPHLCTLIYIYFKLTHKIFTYIIILAFFHENCYFNHKLAPFWCHMSSYCKTTLSLTTKYEGKGTKILIFKLFISELGKIWKCKLGFSKILIPHLFYELGKTWKYTQPQTNISKS